MIFSRICKNIKETGCIHFDVEKCIQPVFTFDSYNDEDV